MMMNNKEKHIENLINLFMQGETSLEQEQELSDYFRMMQEIPVSWLPYKDMFAYFDNGMPLSVKSPLLKIARHRWRRMGWISTAAAVALILSVIAFMNHQQTSVIGPREKKVAIKTPSSIDTSNHKIATPPMAETNVKQSLHEKKTHKKVKPQGYHLDSIEMEKERGQIELAHQEILADKLIAERECEQLRQESYDSRSKVYRASRKLSPSNNSEPQIINVVFK